MTTYRELVYLILDEIKGRSDDFKFTELHIKFLLDKYRAFILKQRYSKAKEAVPQSNYQTITVPMEVIETQCSDEYKLISKNPIPDIMNIGNPIITIDDSSNTIINYVSRERFKYVGLSRFATGIYASIGSNSKLQVKSKNLGIKYIKCLQISGIFEDPSKAAELDSTISNSGEGKCSIDSVYPLEEALIPNVCDMIRKELLGSLYNPEDNTNDSSDSIPNKMLMAQAIANSRNRHRGNAGNTENVS